MGEGRERQACSKAEKGGTGMKLQGGYSRQGSRW